MPNRRAIVVIRTTYTKFDYEYGRNKIEIQQVLDKVPEDALPVILGRLKQFHGQTAEHIKKILTEDRELLEKLAK